MYVNTQMNFILILICSCVHISIVSQVLFMWMPLFSVQGVPNTLQSIPRLNIAKQIFKMRLYQVYSHSYWLTIFWTTNCSPGIEVAFENFGKNFNFSWTPCICELMCPQCDFIMVYLINRFLISVRTDNGRK